MSIFTSILTKGTNNHLTSAEEVNQLATDFISPGVTGAITNTSGVAPMTGAFAINAQGTPDKTITVTLGTLYNTATPSGQGSQTLRVKMDANTALTVADNNTGATRYDWVYLQTLPTSANNPNTAGTDASILLVNRSTSNSTDTSGTVPAYAQLLAIITVTAGFITITNPQIQDKRNAAGAPIPNGSITSTKLANGSVLRTAISPEAQTTFTPPLTNITLGTPGQVNTMYHSKLGRKVEFWGTLVLGTGGAVAAGALLGLPFAADTTIHDLSRQNDIATTWYSVSGNTAGVLSINTASGASAAQFIYTGSSGGNTVFQGIGPVNPGTFGAGSYVTYRGSYIAAS